MPLIACKTCVFFEPPRNPTMHEFGSCHRYPPQPRDGFPFVRPDSIGCGEGEVAPYREGAR